MSERVPPQRAAKSSGRRGSALTDKQIDFAVRDGKALLFHFDSGDTVTGWVFGTDDYHWGLVGVSGLITLVHKSAPSFEVTDHLLSDQSTGVQEDLEPVLCDFRAFVMRNHFQAVPAIT